MARTVTTPDATFQVLDALRTNRRKRRQRGMFLVHGVRSIDAAIANRWLLSTVISAIGRPRSRWATTVIGGADAEHLELAPELFDQLSERDAPSELIAVATLKTATLTDVRTEGVVLILDRPASPGNLGTLIRSADVFGAAGVIVLGHAADPFDPRAVRASVGSLFAVPLVEAGGAADIASWLDATGRRAVGLDESADTPISALAGDGPVALVLGTEGRGMSSAVRDLCSEVASIPMKASAATSLNVAVAGSIALYELSR